MNEYLKPNDLYKRITLDLIRQECEEWVIENGIMTLEEVNNEKMRHKNLVSDLYMFKYAEDKVDWCKMYAFDEDIDSYSDFSDECANRIKLFNLKNSVAFNQSIMNLREAGIHLPDCNMSNKVWPDHERLKSMIENGAEQSEIEVLFSIVFEEYAVLPEDVDMSDEDLIMRYSTVAGMPYHVYLKNTLLLSEYNDSNIWSIKIGKEWLKNR